MNKITPDVERLAERLRLRGEKLATAESCTGGLVAKLLTDLPGSSDWFERGLITYSNAAKQDLLGVPAATLEMHGAVSRQTVEAMAAGLLARAPVQWALAITGIAGPSGGSSEKPVGLVWIACGGKAGVVAEQHRFAGDRGSVREQAAAAALNLLLKSLK
ncbi:MAG: CinA family protein [Pseudomonadota bacterium]